MEALRGRCASPRGRDDTLPVAYHPRPWRTHSGKHVRGHGGGYHGAPRQGRLRHFALRAGLAALAVFVALRLAVHMFGSPEPQLEDLMRLYSDAAGPSGQHVGAGAAAAAGRGGADAAQQPKLIPRLIHQTHAGGSVPPALLPYLASWRRLNPGWEVRLWGDQVGAVGGWGWQLPASSSSCAGLSECSAFAQRCKLGTLVL